MTTLPVFDNGGYHANVVEPKPKIVSIPSYDQLNYSSNTSTTSSLPPPPVPVHQTTVEDQSYLPESSLEVALLTRQLRLERLNAPIDPKFPPVLVENINALRQQAKQSQDPDLRFFFARFLLLECLVRLKPNPTDRTQQLKQTLTSEALQIIKKLASYRSGHAEAQFFLAQAYTTGQYGLKRDLEKAFSLYNQGARLNHPQCTYRAALCYELGLGTKRDERFAIQFYRKAAHLSDPSAIYKLGRILMDGQLGQTKNMAEAISWFSRGTNDPACLHELALAYERTDLSSIIPDPVYAHQLLSQAAQLDYAPSQFRLGWLYEYGNQVDPRRSIAWYSRAAEQGYSEAELAISSWYLTGSEGVLAQNDTEAYLWALKAARKGLPRAEYAVGYYLEMAVGVPRNLVEAKVWYTKAAEHGDPKAKQRLIAFKNQTQVVKRRPTRDKNGKPNSKDSSDCKIM